MSNSNLQGGSPISMKCGGAVPINSVVMPDGTVERGCVVTTGITSPAVGVALATGATGDWIPVQQFGIGKCIASTTIAVNAEVMCDANGKVTTAAGATARSIGTARTAGGAGGADVIEVMLRLPALKAPPNS